MADFFDIDYKKRYFEAVTDIQKLNDQIDFLTNRIFKDCRTYSFFVPVSV